MSMYKNLLIRIQNCRKNMTLLRKPMPPSEIIIRIGLNHLILSNEASRNIVKTIFVNLRFDSNRYKKFSEFYEAALIRIVEFFHFLIWIENTCIRTNYLFKN